MMIKRMTMASFMLLVSAFSYAGVSESAIRILVDKGNAKLPQSITNEIIANEIKFDGKNFIYEHYIKDTPGERVIPSRLGEVVAKPMIHNACSSEVLRAIIDSGYPISFHYYGSDDYFIIGVIVSQSECRRYDSMVEGAKKKDGGK